MNSGQTVTIPKTKSLEVEFYACPILEMGPLWSNIEHGHSGVIKHQKTATFNGWEFVEPWYIA